MRDQKAAPLQPQRRGLEGHPGDPGLDHTMSDAPVTTMSALEQMMHKMMSQLAQKEDLQDVAKKQKHRRGQGQHAPRRVPHRQCGSANGRIRKKSGNERNATAEAQHNQHEKFRVPSRRVQPPQRIGGRASFTSGDRPRGVRAQRGRSTATKPHSYNPRCGRRWRSTAASTASGLPPSCSTTRSALRPRALP